MSDDPHMAAVAVYVEQVMEQVRTGRLAKADALAVLAADTLGLSLRGHVAPDTAAALAAMAQAFATQRYAIVNAAALLAADPVPDDVLGLSDD